MYKERLRAAEMFLGAAMAKARENGKLLALHGERIIGNDGAQISLRKPTSLRGMALQALKDAET